MRLLFLVTVALSFSLAFAETGPKSATNPPDDAIPLPPIGPEPNITAGDFYTVTGILAWEFTVPDDMQRGEYMGTYWRFTDEREEVRALSFKEVPAGERVQIFLWEDEWSSLPDDKKGGGIRYVMKFRLGKETVKREGRLHVPDGFWSFTSYLGPGQVQDGGYLLYLTRRGLNAAGFEVPAIMETGYWSEEDD